MAADQAQEERRDGLVPAPGQAGNQRSPGVPGDRAGQAPDPEQEDRAGQGLLEKDSSPEAAEDNSPGAGEVPGGTETWLADGDSGVTRSGRNVY